MRFPAAILSLSAVLFVSGTVLAGPGDEASLASAKQVAAQRGVPVLLDFFTEW
jgi:hypothetical protein